MVFEGRLLLPFYSNGTVQNLIDLTGGLKLQRIAQIGIDVCKGLHAFHTCDPPLAYRDLKVSKSKCSLQIYCSEKMVKLF